MPINIGRTHDYEPFKRRGLVLDFGKVPLSWGFSVRSLSLTRAVNWNTYYIELEKDKAKNFARSFNFRGPIPSIPFQILTTSVSHGPNSAQKLSEIHTNNLRTPSVAL